MKFLRSEVPFVLSCFFLCLIPKLATLLPAQSKFLDFSEILESRLDWAKVTANRLLVSNSPALQLSGSAKT